MEQAFRTKSYHFDTEVTLTVSEELIVSKSATGTSSLDTKNLDNFQYNYYYEPKISPGGFWFRFIGLSFVIYFSSLFIPGLDGNSLASFKFFLILIVINTLFLFFFVLDSLLELNILIGFINKYFSNHAYYVVIGNKSGNNIEFLVLIQEENKLKELNDYPQTSPDLYQV